jgi:hypothetical protein
MSSAVEFRAKGFFGHVRAVLEETGLEPRYLELELTESVLMPNAESTTAPVRRLVREGGIVTLGVAEGFEERQYDAVCRGPIKGTVAAVGERGTGRAEKAFRAGDAGGYVEAR